MRGETLLSKALYAGRAYLRALFSLPLNVEAAMAKLDELKLAISELENDVQSQTNVVQSAVTLLEGLSQQLRDVVVEATDLDDMRQRLQNLNATLDTERDKLAQAVAANTPGQPEQPNPGNVPTEPLPQMPESEPVVVPEEIAPAQPVAPEVLPEDFGSLNRWKG